MKWDDMHGDERERFCAQCNRSVVNLSRLNAAERAALLASAAPGRLCVAYYQRLTAAPAAIPSEKKLPRAALWRWGAAAAFVVTLGAVAHDVQRRHPPGLEAPLLADRYDSFRYRVEGWIDDVRIFFGGEPRYSGMVAGMVCPAPFPTAIAPPPAASPASSPAAPDNRFGPDRAHAATTPPPSH